MTILLFSLILLIGAFAAGLLGSLTGLGGGVVVIPLLTLCFGVDFHYAVGAALVASIATSSGSGAAYVKEGITNIRLGMLLEIATTLGAVAGAAVAIYLNNSVLAVIFGGVLILTALSQRRKHEDHSGVKGSALAEKLKLYGTYPDKTHQRGGRLRRDALGRPAFGHPRHRIGRAESAGHGQLHESAVQSEHHHV